MKNDILFYEVRMSRNIVRSIENPVRERRISSDTRIDGIKVQPVSFVFTKEIAQIRTPPPTPPQTPSFVPLPSPIIELPTISVVEMPPIPQIREKHPNVIQNSKRRWFNYAFECLKRINRKT